MTKPTKKKTAKFARLRKPKSPAVGKDGERGTKSATVISLLEHSKGATISELAKSTGWQNHSVRGFLSGTITKKLGRKIVSEIVDGDRRYRITG